MTATTSGAASDYVQRVSSTPIRVGVPELQQYPRASGVGRVLWSLADHWGASVELLEEHFIRSSLPLLRTIPRGITRAHQPDVILLPQLTRAEALRLVQGCAGVVIVHDAGIVDFPDDLIALDVFTRWRIRQSFRGLVHATRVISVSNFTAGRLLEHLPEIEDRLITIPNGVGAELLSYDETVPEAEHALREQFSCSIGRPLLLAVGSEHPRKNFSALIEAFRRIRDVHPQAHLLKVGAPGNPDWRERTEQHAAMHGLTTGHDITFLDQVDDMTLARCYRASDLYVSASLYEGFGLPLLEAMATGTPFVVSNRGALPEVAGNLGEVVLPDPSSLASGLLAAIERGCPDEYRTELRRRASMFSWARSAERYLDVMHEVVGQK